MFQLEAETFFDALELLELAREDARQHRDNAGYLHLFAHLFVYTCEKSRGEMREQVRREYYDDVERAVEDAIRLDPAYAKFYCTKARVVAQRGRYAEAYSLINKAVATENSARKDYALRLLDYRHCETVILLQEQREYFQGEMEKLRRSVPSLPKPKTFVPGRGPKAYEGAEPYCFVSYAHINSDRVYPIVEQLMQRGIRLWYDDGIEAGSDFREFIAEKIRDSWQVLLFASHESIQPGFVRNEINYALHCGKPILRVNLDDVELTPGMELSLGGMQYVDATEPGGRLLDRRLRSGGGPARQSSGVPEGRTLPSGAVLRRLFRPAEGPAGGGGAVLAGAVSAAAAAGGGGQPLQPLSPAEARRRCQRHRGGVLMGREL